uniref:Uncharacterized protein n=1 Tax=Zea mays TaxID=4577 RepID=C4J5N4_MAIZE|nr:unknown [Zea mays]
MENGDTARRKKKSAHRAAGMAWCCACTRPAHTTQHWQGPRRRKNRTIIRLPPPLASYARMAANTDDTATTYCRA